MLADLEDNVYNLSVGENITATFDLNGHKFKTDESQNNIVYGTLIFMDSSKDEAGLYYCEVDYVPYIQDKGVIDLEGEKSLLIIESGRIEARNGKGEFSVNEGQYGIGLHNGANVIMNGGTIKAGWYCIAGNGQDKKTSSNITINGGNLISVCDYVFYLPHRGITTINGGVIDGAAGAISIRSGTLIINDGVFSSNGTGDTGNWSDGTGSNIDKGLVNCQSDYGSVSVSVNGGTYNVEKMNIFSVVENKYQTSIAIKAGTYNQYLNRWVLSGYSCADNNDGTWSVVKNS